MILIHIILFLLSFFLIWFSSRLIIEGVDAFAKKIKLSAFATSFFLLGVLTSLPEFSIGFNAVLDNQPGIFVGNLIGASFVLLMLIIPLVTIIGNGINLEHQLNLKTLILSLIVIIGPAFFVLDGQLDQKEGLILMVLYGLLVYVVEKRKNFVERFHDTLFDGRADGWRQIAKLIAGAVIIFLASKLLVKETIYFSQWFHISTFIISLIILSVGTNMPEIVIGVSSILRRKKAVALGDYLGSAAFNSFLFGVLGLIQGSFKLIGQDFYLTFWLFLAGGLIFFVFMRSKRRLSRFEGFVILAIYLLFLLLEVFSP